MTHLIYWLNIILKKRKELKRWKRIVTVLAAVMTFATTYALILPAITVERDNTDSVAGMYLDGEAAQDDLLTENALEPVGFRIAADQENAVTFAYADNDMTATAIFSTIEAIPEGAELVVNPVDRESEEYADLSSRSADLLDKEFIYDVTTCSFYDFALVCDNVDVTPKTGLVDIQIIFRSNTVEHINDVVYVGRYARPTEEVEGLVELAAGDEASEDELVFINADESSVVELTDGIITAISLKGNDLARSDSILGILAGNVNEEIRAAAADTDAEIPTKGESLEENAPNAPADNDDEELTAALQPKTLEASGDDYTVTLTYDDTSGIPEGAALTVSEIAPDSEEYQTYLKETKKAMGLMEEETLPSFAARFFDIKIMVGEEEFTPEAGVSVEITYAEPLAENTDAEVSAVHFSDEKAEAEVLEANTSEVQDDGKATVEFTAESFSVYGVVYTVDFHWEVDGKTYDFSIPGGGFVTLEHLVDVLSVGLNDTDTEKGAEKAEKEGEISENSNENSGNESGNTVNSMAEGSSMENADTDTHDAGNTNDTAESGAAEDSNVYEETMNLNNVPVSEEAKRFVVDVASVEFSSPELVWVGKIEEESTVAEIKKANGLECQYSAELTEEQVDEINNSTVKAGDWALISVQPFTSEETLVVVMRNGDRWTVKVTDAQISTHVITADGKDYVITVTYGPEAEIPDGAELTAVEIEPGTNAYEKYLAQAEEALGRNADSDEEASDYIANRNAFARFFDISIVAEGKEIEPKAPVSVEIAYADSADVPQGIIDVVHFADSGIEIIDSTRYTENDGTIVNFEQGSFSVTGTIIDYSSLADGDYYILYKSYQGRWYALTSAGTSKDVTQYYDNVSGSIVNYDGAENITWTFTKVNGTTSDYVIKAKGENIYVSLQYAPSGTDYWRGNVVTNNYETIAIRDDPNSSDPQIVNILNYTSQTYTYYAYGYPRQVTAGRTYRLGWTSNGLQIGQGGLIFKPDEYMYTNNPYQSTYMGPQTAAGVNLARVSEDSGSLNNQYPTMTYNEEQLDQWLNKAMTEDPIQGLSKVASVYDYDNRIYEIDFAMRSGVLAMASDLSMAFVTDVSNSMLFPAKLTPKDGYGNVLMRSSDLNSLPHNNGEVYFTVSDKSKSSTVFAIYYDNGWKAMDASYYARWKAGITKVGDTDPYDYVRLRQKDIGSNAIGLYGNDGPTTGYTIYTANDEFFDGIANRQIYDMSDGQDLDNLIQYNDDGTVTINGTNMGNRLYYLESSIASSVKDMQTIAANYPLGNVYVALETFAKTVQDVHDYEKIGGLADNMTQANADYNANYETLFNYLTAIKGVDGTNQQAALSDTTMFGTYNNNNGRFSGGYINNSDPDKNIAASKKYVVLITDGAPNGTDIGPSNIQTVAERLKANGVNVITIGLSIEDVTVAPEILWWAASGVNTTDPTPKTYSSNYHPTTSNEPRLFYWAQSGEDLTYILREIVRTVMKEASVNATLTDKIDKLFYPVDKNGVPLKDGDWITEDGTRCESTDPDRLGQISCDANGQYSVTWENQDMGWRDWTSTIFVKAKEDFLGGNTMATNTEAKAYPVSYAVNKGQSDELKRTYTATEQAELTMSLSTPYVNVDNLKMNGNNTDFTVHVGTEVDPSEELVRLWNEIKINEVIKPDGANANYEMTDENQVFYSFDRQQDKINTDLLWEGNTPYGTIPLNHYVSVNVLNDLIAEVKGGATTKTATSEPIIYAPYGSTNTAGYLTVTLKKTLSYYSDDETKNKAPDAHEADNTWLTLESDGDLTETYELKIEYTPYTPAERKTALGITDTGTGYMNNGAGSPGYEMDPTNSQRSDDVVSQNRHRVYVYARGLEITKTNPDFSSVVKGAKFALYRAANADDPDASKTEVPGLTGYYVKVADLDTSTSGVAEINPTRYPHAIRAQSREGATYYLVETVAPPGYIKLPSPIEVTLRFSDLYTPKPGSIPQETQPATGLYDWDQEAVLALASDPSVRLCDVYGNPISEGSYEIYYYTYPNTYTDVMYYSIANNPGFELPATGGPGTNRLTLIGLMLTVISGVGLAMRKKQKSSVT